MWIWWKRISVALVIFLAVSQIVRPSRANPPINPEREIHAVLPVDSTVASILSRSCNDCHSNRTVWPWYSQVAPISWLLAYDVRQGRRKLNFSEWNAQSNEATQDLVKEICTEVTEGEMPGRGYSLIHPEARLSQSDVQAVCGWSRVIGEGFAKLGTRE